MVNRGIDKLLELKETSNFCYGLLAGGFILYVILFLLLFNPFGTVVGAFILFPLIIASWFFELKGGLYTLAFIIPIHGFLYSLFSEPFLQSIVSDIPGFAASFVVVLAIGTASKVYSKNKRIQAELAEEVEMRQKREMLLREANHRFKNNLSMLSGIMEIDLMETTDDTVKEILSQCISRINSLAQLHDDISWNNDGGKVNLNNTINSLATSIDNTFSEDKQISLALETEDVFVDAEEASSYSLILNELLTNAYKHAFDKQGQGVIEVELQQKNNLLTLQVTDNGRGLPEDFDLEQSGQHSLGMMLIKNLSDQLNATLKFRSSNGAEFILEKELNAS